MAAKVQIDVVTDASGAISGFKITQQAGEQALGGIQAGAVAAGTVVGNLLTKGLELAAAATRSLFDAAQGWVAASNEQENAVKSLEAALRSSDELTPQLLAHYQDLAAGFQATTTAADELVVRGMSKLVTIGGVSRDQMAQTTQSALDLAAGLRIDLDTAFQMVAKGAAGHTEALGRYGLTVQTTGDKTRDLKALNEAIAAHFGGQAAAAAETYEGKMLMLSNRIGETHEALGDYLKEAGAPFVAVAAQAAASLETLVKAHKPELVRAFAEALSFVVDAAAFAVESVAMLVSAYGTLREAFANLLKVGTPVVEMFYLQARAYNEFTKMTTLGLVNFDGVVNGLRDGIDTLKTSIEFNISDQEKYNERLKEGAKAASEKAAALRDRLKGALEEVKDKAGEAREELNRVTEAPDPTSLAGAQKRWMEFRKRIDEHAGEIAKGLQKIAPQELHAQSRAISEQLGVMTERYGSMAIAVRALIPTMQELIKTKERLGIPLDAADMKFKVLISTFGQATEKTKAHGAATIDVIHGVRALDGSLNEAGKTLQRNILDWAANKDAVGVWNQGVKKGIDEVIARIEAYKNISQSIDIATDKKVTLTKEQSEALVASLESTTKQNAQTKAAIESAKAAIKAGDVGQIENLIKSAEQQYATFSTYAPQLAESQKALANTLGQLLTAIQKAGASTASQTPAIPRHAGGGLAAPGWAMVGEEGPELVRFAERAQVYSSSETKEIIREGRGGGIGGARMVDEARLAQMIGDRVDRAVERLGGAISGRPIQVQSHIAIDGRELASVTRDRAERGATNRYR